MRCSGARIQCCWNIKIPSPRCRINGNLTAFTVSYSFRIFIPVKIREWAKSWHIQKASKCTGKKARLNPTKGRVLIDGTDLRELGIDDWWNTLGCLFQDFEPYSLKIDELIALGDLKKGYDIEKVKQAGAKAGVDRMVSQWKQSWHQLIGRGYSDGVELSAGQHQRVALARLFYRDPRIMLLDEPTSWVDVPTESTIFRELRELPENRTLIFISHRFSTVRQAGQIILLQNGVITEQGSHQELLRQGNDYARRYNEEAQHYLA
jgi:ATP-binding cassette subfamily B protein